MSATTEVLLEGLSFGEGPRWRSDRLYLSDFHTESVLAVDLDGSVDTVVTVPGQPSGLGWLPDGRMLVVSMGRRAVMAWDGSTLAPHADLRPLASFGCNDMVVGGDGRAYVGCCDLAGIPNPKPSELMVVDPDGTAEVVEAVMQFPNGSVITPDGSTLIVAETFGDCLTAFRITTNGRLADRRVWAPLHGGTPDGICLDAEGAVWYADPVGRACVRVLEGGDVTDRVETGAQCFACTLGGPDGRTLFMITGKLIAGEEARSARPGKVLVTEVDVPGAGSP
jgi:sugar lactone lactonase YvrE